MSDLAELVVRARAGDEDSFAVLVRRFQDMAVGYGYWMLRDLHLAEDAAQEAFLEAYLCLSNLREPAAFPGWFRRIVIKQCDRLTRGKKPRLEPLQSANEAPSHSPDQVTALEQQEMHEQIWAAIDALPQHERAVAVLFYFGGHSQQEVSDFLDVPVSTIKKRLFSARGRLRAILIDVVADTLRERRPSRDETFSAAILEMLNAARAGDAARVKQLLKRNRSLLTERDWLGNSALIIAVNSGQQALAELLMKAGVQPDIHEAAAIGDTRRVANLLKEDINRLDQFSEEGFTAVGVAAHFGHRETTEFLIAQGANLSIIARHALQVTPLHAALFGQQMETARLLIAHGSDVNARRGGKGWPRAGWTPLHYVASSGMTEMVGPLLAAGANPTALDDEGRSPLDLAIEGKHDEAAALLKQ